MTTNFRLPTTTTKTTAKVTEAITSTTAATTIEDITTPTDKIQKNSSFTSSMPIVVKRKKPMKEFALILLIQIFLLLFVTLMKFFLISIFNFNFEFF